MKKIMLFAFTTIMVINVLVAQTENEKKVRGAVVNFIGGYGYATVTGVEQFFPAGAITLNQNHYTFGAQILYLSNNYLFGFSGYTIFGDKYVGDSSEVTTQTSLFTLNFGYLLTPKPNSKFKCYPLLALGGGGTTIMHTRTKDLTVADIQSNPFTASNLLQPTLTGDASFNLAYVISKTTDDDYSKGGLSVGLQLGYTYGLGVGDWQFGDAKVTDADDYTIGMPYAKLTFGFHSF